MRVRITAKAGYSNPRRGIEFPLGAVAEIPDDVAVKLLNMGLAVPPPAPEREAAVLSAPRNAAKHVSKPKASKRSRPAKEEAD